MYRKIANHPTVRQLWVKTLVERGVIEEGLAESLVRKHTDHLQSVYESLEPERQLVEPVPEPPPRGAARHARTAVSVERLRQLNESLLAQIGRASCRERV